MDTAVDIFVTDQGGGHKFISKFTDAPELSWVVKCPISRNNHSRTFEAEI